VGCPCESTWKGKALLESVVQHRATPPIGFWSVRYWPAFGPLSATIGHEIDDEDDDTDDADDAEESFMESDGDDNEDEDAAATAESVIVIVTVVVLVATLSVRVRLVVDVTGIVAIDVTKSVTFSWIKFVFVVSRVFVKVIVFVLVGPSIHLVLTFVTVGVTVVLKVVDSIDVFVRRVVVWCAMPRQKHAEE
jgi:hypothetical protein